MGGRARKKSTIWADLFPFQFSHLPSRPELAPPHLLTELVTTTATAGLLGRSLLSPSVWVCSFHIKVKQDRHLKMWTTVGNATFHPLLLLLLPKKTGSQDTCTSLSKSSSADPHVFGHTSRPLFLFLAHPFLKKLPQIFYRVLSIKSEVPSHLHGQ